MKAPHTGLIVQNGLAAHILRPVKNARLTFKDTSAPEQGTRVEQYAMRAVAAKRRQAQSKADTYTHALKRSTYNGAELRPYDGRPGSLDFLALPSLMGSRRIYRKDQNKTEAQA